MAAQHLNLIVKAQGVLCDLILIFTHKAKFDAALKDLSQFVQTPGRVIFSTALDVLWVVTQCVPSGSDAFKCLYVSIFTPRAGGIHVKPLRPDTLWLAGARGPGGAGSDGCC